jgi:OmpA-OmpF porin, OOP family
VRVCIRGVFITIYGILFDTGSSLIKAQSKASLDQIAVLLQQNPALKLHVVGYTDNHGNLDSNFALSKARASAVATSLTAQYGIAATRLSANGVSSLAPIASNTDEAGRAKNRRVELVPF